MLAHSRDGQFCSYPILLHTANGIQQIVCYYVTPHCQPAYSPMHMPCSADSPRCSKCLEYKRLKRYLALDQGSYDKTKVNEVKVSRFLMDDSTVHFSAGWIVLATDQPSLLISNFLSLCSSYLFIGGFSPLSFCKFCLSTSPQTCTVSSKRRRTKQRFA